MDTTLIQEACRDLRARAQTMSQAYALLEAEVQRFRLNAPRRRPAHETCQIQ